MHETVEQNHDTGKMQKIFSKQPAYCHFPLCHCSNIRCFRVDPSPSAPCVNERHGAPAVWSHGYTEASGVKNKSVLQFLCFYHHLPAVIVGLLPFIDLKIRVLIIRHLCIPDHLAKFRFKAFVFSESYKILNNVKCY